MKLLTVDECKDVIKRYNRGQPPWAIAVELDISREDIRGIRHCKRQCWPLTDYKVAFDEAHKKSTIDEKESPWDLRMSMKLARLPMSEWAAAL